MKLLKFGIDTTFSESTWPYLEDESDSKELKLSNNVGRMKTE